ncbi:hypothetical protein FA13DRAFT_210499 [Coprinellus micaceus]|uniref:Uncharacterized protein n=1 Tax=Coprinellus micaceus TaxID=71717 RepID=A0A4Y7SF71_COPMI|nr:hypothetical protein FA13DRAFT_210499 [Coprinellus micaceus]
MATDVAPASTTPPLHIIGPSARRLAHCAPVSPNERPLTMRPSNIVECSITQPTNTIKRPMRRGLPSPRFDPTTVDPLRGGRPMAPNPPSLPSRPRRTQSIPATMSATTAPLVAPSPNTAPTPTPAMATTPANNPPPQATAQDVQSALVTGTIAAPPTTASSAATEVSALARRVSSRLAGPPKDDNTPEPASPSKRKASGVRKNATMPAAGPDPAITRLEADMTTMQASFADASAGIASNAADIREVAGTMHQLEHSVALADKNIEALTNAINIDLGTVLDNMTTAMEEDRKKLGEAVARIEELATRLTDGNQPVSAGVKRPRVDDDVGPVRPAPVTLPAPTTHTTAPTYLAPATAATATPPPMGPPVIHTMHQQAPMLPAHLAAQPSPATTSAPPVWAPSAYTAPYATATHTAPRRGPTTARFVYAQFGPVNWVGPDYLEELRQLIVQHVTHGTGFTGLIKAASPNTVDPRFLVATFNTVKQARDVVNAWNQDTAAGQWRDVHGTIVQGN